MKYWIRIGDSGDYHSFDDLNEVIEYLNECNVGKIDHWVDGSIGTGIDTPNFHGHDFVSLYYGDLASNFVRALNSWEQTFVEKNLETVFN